MWREATEDPLPRMPPGDPETQIQGFELKLVELLCGAASAGPARRAADTTWALALVAGAIAGVAYWRAERITQKELHALVALGTVILTLANYYVGPTALYP